MNKIGIMQGRLSPQIGDKIQEFPWDTWKEEFSTAKELGFDSIEFIVDGSKDYKENPLWNTPERITDVIKETGVQINYVCADYFMEHPFFRVSNEEKKKSENILKELIVICANLDIKGIEIPLVDNSKIETDEEMDQLVEVLKRIIPDIEKHNIQIGLETSLDAKMFKKLLDTINHPLITANYDSGNSSSLGYDVKEEIDSYGEKISNIHIKDRVLHGGTVSLGTGDADFNRMFESLRDTSYKGDFILQAARAEDGNEIENAKKNLDFVKKLINTYLV
tara:strand:- start:17125 stop:17958 length:834 start_codon:yes stop_codon:yes gene_type:complete